MTSEPAEPVTFRPLGEYELPTMPAVHALRRFATMLRLRLQQSEHEPVLANDRLQRTSSSEVDRIVGPPAYGSLLDELDHTLHPWRRDDHPSSWLTLVVLPPCDRPGLLRAWADERGHAQLVAPSNAEVLAGHVVQPDALQGSGVLVIPDLACWFMRHRNGLQTLRSLLILLSQLQRHCVIGCNSWAWAYLCKAVGANLVLPPAITFKAFDAERLREWFLTLAASTEDASAVTFRLADSGVDVMALDDEGTLKDAYLKRLAARSFGMPWVAWHLWRLALRSRLEENNLSDEQNQKISQATHGDERTIWVAGFDELSLPKQHEDGALLVLQALLIHGELSGAELRSVLPYIGEVDFMPALMRAGYVQRNGERFHVEAAAYPQAREALSTAGFPLDRL